MQKKHSPWLCFLKSASITILVAGPFLMANSAFSLTYNLTPKAVYFDYLEVDDQGDTLDTETGWLSGIDAGISIPAGDFTFSSHVNYLQGDVAYNGHTQAGAVYRTQTQQQIINYGVSSQHSFNLDRFTLTPSLAMDKFYWRRDIQRKGVVSGLTEDYQWLLIKPSLELIFSSNNLPTLSWQLGITRSENITMKIHATACTQSVTVFPKADNGWFSQFKVYSFTSPQYGIATFLRYENWKMKKSDREIGNSCVGPLTWREPKNETQLWSLGMMVHY